jgi:hypothetical protein
MPARVSEPTVVLGRRVFAETERVLRSTGSAFRRIGQLFLGLLGRLDSHAVSSTVRPGPGPATGMRAAISPTFLIAGDSVIPADYAHIASQ